MSHLNLDPSKEQWKPVPYPYFCQHYAVSNYGKIMRYSPGHGTRAGKIIKPCATHTYMRLNLLHKGKSKGVSVSRTVALAFIGEPPEGKPQCDHINGDKKNNNVENLRWLSDRANKRAAFALGLFDGWCNV